MHLHAILAAGRRLAPLALTALATTGCAYRLGPQDVFTFQSPSAERARPVAPPDGGFRVIDLDVAVEGQPVAAWLAARPGSTGVLLFFSGRGSTAAAVAERLLPRAARLGLDVAVLDYRPEGREPPSVGWTRRAARAVLARVAAVDGAAGDRIYVGGHSMGAWFALDLAGEPSVTGAFTLGAGTTAVEVGQRLAWARLWPVRVQPDDDVRQLDAPALAGAARAPVLVIGSRRDSLMLPEFQERIAAALPAGLERRLVILDDVDHHGYLRDDRVWAEIAAFLRLPARPAGAAATASAIIAP